MTLCRSASQNRDEFDKFLDNLELSIDHMAEKNLYMMVAIRYFNATHGMLMTTQILKDQKLTI